MSKSRLDPGILSDVNEKLPAPITDQELERLGRDEFESLIYAPEAAADIVAEVLDWRRAERAKKMAERARGSETAGLFAACRQQAIAREVDESGFSEREASAPSQHSTFTVEDFRDQVLAGQLLEPEEVEGWILEPRRRIPGNRVLEYLPTRESVVPISIGFKTTSPTGDLERLAALVKAITAEFGWHPAEAVGYILTGFVPAPKKLIQTEYEGERRPVARRITLSIDPHSTPEEVAMRYREYRKSVLGDERVRRPSSPRRLRLYMERYEDRDDESWPRRWQQWQGLTEEMGRPEWGFDGVRPFREAVLEMSKRGLTAPWLRDDELRRIG